MARLCCVHKGSRRDRHSAEWEVPMPGLQLLCFSERHQMGPNTTDFDSKQIRRALSCKSMWCYLLIIIFCIPFPSLLKLVCYHKDAYAKDSAREELRQKCSFMQRIVPVNNCAKSAACYANANLDFSNIVHMHACLEMLPAYSEAKA
eukprot:1159913-Pelagomonas_calceolata.AAC.4